jgi:hypothetical protein
VTAGWGFVVVHTKKIDQGMTSFCLSLFSVNGELIRRRAIDFQIQAWTTWTSPSGFDYFVAASDDGRLYTMEAYYLNADSAFDRIRTKSKYVDISSMQYLPAIQSLLVVAEGKIAVYSASHMGLSKLDRQLYPQPP